MSDEWGKWKIRCNGTSAAMSCYELHVNRHGIIEFYDGENVAEIPLSVIMALHAGSLDDDVLDRTPLNRPTSYSWITPSFVAFTLQISEEEAAAALARLHARGLIRPFRDGWERVPEKETT